MTNQTHRSTGTTATVGGTPPAAAAAPAASADPRDQEILRLQERIQNLEQGIRSSQPGVRTRLVLVVLAGLLGWAPPLVLELYAAWTIWGFCCRRKSNAENASHGSASGSDAPSLKTKILTVLRYTFLILISIVDFADGILDIIVSVAAIWNTSSDDEDNDPYTRKWAMILFSMTLVARLLGGVFGVFYESIDKADREATYFLVELMIFVMEDGPALYFLAIGGINTRLERANLFLTYICGVVFCVSMLCSYKSIVKRLPRFASCALLIFYGFLAFGFILGVYLFSIGGFEPNYPSIEEKAELDFIFSITYPINIVFQLGVLFFWCRSLARTTGQPPRQDAAQDAAPASEEFSV